MTILLLLGISLLFIAFILVKVKGKRQNTKRLNADWLPTYGSDVSHRNNNQSDYLSIKIDTTFKLNEEDDQAGSFDDSTPYVVGEEKDIWLELDIDYIDARGGATNRQIKLKSYCANTEQTDARLFAFCYLRNANRTFYASRIKRCVDLENGEVIDNIPNYLEQQYDNLYVDGEDNKLLVELAIDYRERNGKSVPRQVKVKRFRVRHDKTEAILWGYCSLENKNSEFYASRITSCLDLGTGLEIDNIIEYISTKYEESSEVQLSRIWANINDELSLLVYVGKLDGMLKQNEKQIIASYALLKNPTTLATEEEIVAGMKEISLLSKNQFARLLGKLSSKEEQEKNELLDYAERVINTKRKKSAVEEAILPYIAKRLFPNKK